MSKHLDDDLTQSRLSRYHKLEPDVKTYLFNLLSTHNPNLLPKYSTTDVPYTKLDLLDLLHDGEILCKLGQLLTNIPSNPTTKYKSSSMPFIQMENINNFLLLCKIIKVPEDEIFQTIDLFEKKDPYSICICLMSFSRIVNNLEPQVFNEVIGPKKVKIKPVVPNKPRNLKG
ncbi:SCP1 [Candida pseudojiufengensis]|uniref:SCP1 n=1 Tax=Candida pseudojiufengensis TaxID=497109 RepID=UPI0022240390|nr:SCP1 [Candida pseudojiufengensis]KAI5966388.1 SCP1 [Candida pseudojiufengensis]